ncbi:hypothetical protein J4216_01785 [Candidatus Woesearchaeota archaeon]|nr:hypothetical protein [Candidatus Woesearchaeota archaeon]
MNKIKPLLDLRKKIKDKTPPFERQEANKIKQFRGKWRKPKGIQSKLRRGFRGHRNIPSIGYAGPNLVKGLTKHGLMPILVSNINDLSKVVENCCVIISSGVGIKKRLLILDKAKSLGLKVLGVKDIEAYVVSVKDILISKKQGSASRKEQKKKKLSEAKEKKKEESHEHKDHDHSHHKDSKEDTSNSKGLDKDDHRIDPYAENTESTKESKPKKKGVKKNEPKK